MKNRLQPHITTSVDVAFELGNLWLSQLSRVTQMGIQHTQQTVVLTQHHMSESLTTKTAEDATARLNEAIDAHVKNLIEFVTDLCELSINFQSEDALFAESQRIKTSSLLHTD
jgi:hypothetical protein